jgi:competence protein ComEA
MYKLIRSILVACLFSVAPLALAEPLDINAATAEQIADTLDGVGKAKAEAIVQDREKNGKFKSVDDLGRVKGIGAATIEKNRAKLTVGGAEAPDAVAKPAAAPAAPPQKAAKPK